jgi:hypothetical protein
MNDSQHESEKDLQAPSRLIAALKDASREKMFVPPYVDASVLKAARQHLAKDSEPRRPFFRSWKFWRAFATACLVIGGLIYLVTGAFKSGQTRFAHEDINHDGRVDILDSFALAREIKDGKTAPASLDINGDGVVDDRDVKLLTVRAVRLEKGPS